MPVGSDPYALTADLKKAFESARSIIPVADAAERDALAALFPGGVLPDKTTVARGDLRGALQVWSTAQAQWSAPAISSFGQGSGVVPETKAGEVQVITDAYSVGNFVFPVPFANALTAVTLTRNHSTYGPMNYNIISDGTSRTGVRFCVEGLANTTLFIGYFAAGW